jgi:hypothetical protein
MHRPANQRWFSLSIDEKIMRAMTKAEYRKARSYLRRVQRRIAASLKAESEVAGK